MFVSTVFDVRTKDSGVNWIPPAVGTFDNDIKVARIDMHVVFFTVVTNDCSEYILLLGCNRVLRS